MPGLKQKNSANPSRFRRSGVTGPIQAALLALVLLLTLAPLAGQLSGPDYWPGFFYAPFYTTNIFTDPTTPAYRAGLQPEDRVVGVQLNQRIEKLNELTARQGAAGQPVRLIYELGRELTAIKVPVERLDWPRLLEKWGPLLLAAGWLAWLAFSFNLTWAWLGALSLLAAVDYWMNPGAGRESGLDPAAWLAAGELWRISAKWSAYLYWPLWTVTLLFTGLFLAGKVWRGRARKLVWAILWSAALAELAAYSYDAVKSATYNNPDYIIWHARAIFWPAWGVLLLLAAGLALKWKSRPVGWLALAGLALFTFGFIYPTTFDSAWPGPGPQWFALGLPLFAYGATARIASSRATR